MTVQDIKESISMLEILDRYGIKVDKRGLCSCPFHKDLNPSMKIYKNGFYCFSCNAGSDVIDFVMKMEDVSFGKAFKMLGGKYDYEFRNELRKIRIKKQEIEKEVVARKLKMQETSNDIAFYRNCMKLVEANSDIWCDCYNLLQRRIYEYEYMAEKGREL